LDSSIRLSGAGAAEPEVRDAPVHVVRGGAVRRPDVPGSVIPAPPAVDAGAPRRGILTSVGGVIRVRPVQGGRPLPDVARHVQNAVRRGAAGVAAGSGCAGRVSGIHAIKLEAG